MSKEVKNRWLDIKKCRFNIKDPLDYKDYAIALMISVNNIARPDNEDGTVDVEFKAKACGTLIIKDEFDKIIVKSDKRSQGQLLHHQIVLNEDRLPDCDKMDREDYYKFVMQKIRHYCPMILKMIPEWDKENL